MILDCNAEELQIIANKRLCKQTADETRQLVMMMAKAVISVCPEFSGLLVPMCMYHGNVCHEMHSCRESNK